MERLWPAAVVGQVKAEGSEAGWQEGGGTGDDARASDPGPQGNTDRPPVRKVSRPHRFFRSTTRKGLEPGS